MFLFLYDRIEFNECSLMTLTVFNEFCELPSYGVYIMEARQGHVAVQVCCGGTRVNREDFYGSLALLKLYGHHAHHGILCSLTGHIGQWVPEETDFRWNRDVDDASLIPA